MQSPRVWTGSVYSRPAVMWGGIMNARLERKLRLFAGIIAVGTIAGLSVSFAQGRTSPAGVVVGITYGLSMSAAIGGALATATFRP